MLRAHRHALGRQALLADPEFLAGMLSGFPAMFAHGVRGYVDDRLADGVGWGSFDVARISCPVTVIHGGSDTVVPGAKLRVFDELGHFSIVTQIEAAVAALVRA